MSNFKHRPYKLTIIETYFRFQEYGMGFIKSYLHIDRRLLNQVVKEYHDSKGFIIVASKINQEIDLD